MLSYHELICVDMRLVLKSLYKEHTNNVFCSLNFISHEQTGMTIMKIIPEHSHQNITKMNKSVFSEKILTCILDIVKLV